MLAEVLDVLLWDYPCHLFRTQSHSNPANVVATKIPTIKNQATDIATRVDDLVAPKITRPAYEREWSTENPYDGFVVINVGQCDKKILQTVVFPMA